LIKSEEYHTFDVSSTKISASPKQVLSFIDSFGWSKEWLMVVGGSKGAILDSCVHRLLTSGLLSIHFKEPFSQVFTLPQAYPLRSRPKHSQRACSLPSFSRWGVMLVTAPFVLEQQYSHAMAKLFIFSCSSSILRLF
jgi:hypothetical protein